MKIALFGYGKMGKVIEKIAKNRGHKIIYRIDENSINYDLKKVEIVTMDLKELLTNSIHKSETLTAAEYNFQDLWNNYFKSTNIKSRINLKLHQQHVPKRYWKYLSEKREVV